MNDAPIDSEIKSFLKKTNLGWVTEDWPIKKVNDIAKVKVGRDLKEDIFNEARISEYQYPVYSNTVEDRGLYGFYSEPEYEKPSVTVVGRGAGLGTAFAREKPFGAIGRLLVLIPGNDINIKFLAEVINNRVRFFNESTGVPQLTGVQVKTYGIPVPPLSEQKGIIKILENWDETINTLQKLIHAKKRYKKGLMQQLLSGRKRFREFEGEEWVEVELGNAFQRVTEKNESEEVTNVLTISAQDGLVSQTDYYNKSVASKNLSRYIILKKGDFAYNKSYSDGYSLGAIKRLEAYEEGVLSPLYICFRPDSSKINSDFMTHYFENGGLDHEIYKIAREGARNHGLLNVGIKNFFKANLKVPQINEQKKIASVLNNVKKEIELLEQKLEAIKKQKKGLMQQLLTGKVRVNEELTKTESYG